MKKMVFFLLILIPVLFSAVYGSDLEDVQKAGIIRFCVAPDKAPFTFYNSDDELTGIDVELMKEIAERMGLKIEVSEISSNDLEEALEIGQADIIGGAFSVTQSRKEKIDFTKTYYIADPVFVCKNSLELSEPLKENSFDGRKIGVLKNSGFEEWLRSDLLENGYIQKKDIYTYDDMENAMKALERGRIDLVLTDASLYETRFEDDSLYRTYTYGSAKDSYAFGLRKGSDLKTEVNNQL
ncbi:MAG: amino acid ABC transporter substrate-binding protein, partial [Anaerolineaceae bacterium]|nr:amino acid ABC transporter substrate-binding protein [Anaerolineaceae bacterium]